MNILFTSAGRRSYLIKYFKEEIELSGSIHVGNSSLHSTAMQSGDYAVLTPFIYDPQYIPFLIKYCIQYKIDAIIPLFDIDLPVLSRCKNEFEEIGVQVIVSDHKIVEICNDKWLTYLFLNQNGFQTPKTYITIEEVKKDLKAGIVKFPLFLKPRRGMGSLSMYEAENLIELEVFYEKITREINSNYLQYESNQDEKNIVIQEKLAGTEYGVDIINDLNGNYQATIVKEKIAMRAGETDCARTVHNDSLTSMGKRISCMLGHIGNLDLDAFIVNDTPYIIELNARIGGGYPFSHLAGVNLPKAILNWLRNLPVEQSLFEVEKDVIGYKNMTVISGKSKTESLLPKRKVD